MEVRNIWLQTDSPLLSDVQQIKVHFFLSVQLCSNVWTKHMSISPAILIPPCCQYNLTRLYEIDMQFGKLLLDFNGCKFVSCSVKME